MSTDVDLLNIEFSQSEVEHTTKLSFDDGKQKTAEEYEKEIYDLEQLLEISRSLCTTVELSTLIESILYVSMAQMRVLEAGVFILRSIDSKHYRLGNNVSGFELDQSIDYVISADSALIEKITVPHKVFTMRELWELLPNSKELKLISTLNPTLVVPLVLKNRLVGILLLGERIALGEDPSEYTEYEKKEIYTIASLAAVAVNNASLIEMSSTDMMTKLKLKYYFFNVLTDKLDLAASQNMHLSVLMLDIDFFKRFNDTYGHACGDYVLKEVAKIIKSSIRGQDVASRYGGEEFTVLLNKTSKKDALLVAERIRANVESFDFFYQNQHMKVTISIGVATYAEETNPISSAKGLVDQADQALYISKRNGRNKVTFADPAVLAILGHSSASL